MGFPKLLQDLYENSGAGPKLKSSILPIANNTKVGGITLSDSAGTADANEGIAVTPKALKDIADAKANASATVNLSGNQTIVGTKTFSASPKVPTAVKGTNSTVAASTEFVQTAIGDKANDADVVKLTGNQSIDGEKTFLSSPKVPTVTAGDNTQKTASTAFVKTAIDNSVNTVKAVSYSVQTLTDAEKTQARANIDSAENNVVPIGSYIYYAGSSVPDHYLLCNGAAVSRSEYADLFNVIGTTYGSGDGSTTFNLPSSIDKFLEGSGTAGTVKAAGLPNITGTFGNCEEQSAVVNGVFTSIPTEGGAAPDWEQHNNQGINIYMDASRASAIYGNSTTVQPPALTALPCIRYE